MRDETLVRAKTLKPMAVTWLKAPGGDLRFVNVALPADRVHSRGATTWAAQVGTEVLVSRAEGASLLLMGAIALPGEA